MLSLFAVCWSIDVKVEEIKEQVEFGAEDGEESDLNDEE